MDREVPPTESGVVSSPKARSATSKGSSWRVASGKGRAGAGAGARPPGMASVDS